MPAKYLVQREDTWEKIAEKYGITAQALRNENRWLPETLIPGTVLWVPLPSPILPPESYSEYVIQPGDTLSSIARRFGLDLHRLIRQNPQIRDPNRIYPGQFINLIFLGG